MSPAEILKEARGLVSRGWSQKSFARDNQGEACWLLEPTAASWCPVGAVAVVTNSLKAETPALSYLQDAVGADWIGALSVWNDSPDRTQEHVLMAFDAAIALAEVAS